MKKVVKIYIGNKVFECIDYTFNAPRMGSAPTITTKLKSFDSLDSDIKDEDVYAEYNGEKYLLLNTPKSSKSNEDARFEYDFSFVAGRFILDNIYLHDTDLKTTEVRFSGTIREYANYINKSLEYSGLSYRVVVDESVESESKFFSLNDTAISSAIQESYKQYEIPYYYVGEEIHFGYSSDVINHVFKYGINDGLLNISKIPVGNKIINRATGVGSEENIPYYYPNEHPLGIVDTYYTPYDGEKTLRNDLVVNKNKFAKKVKNATTLTYKQISYDEYRPTTYLFTKDMYEQYEDAPKPSWLIDNSDLDDMPRRALSYEYYWNLSPFVFDKRWKHYDKRIENIWDGSFAFLVSAYKKVSLLSEPLWFRGKGRSLGDNCIYFEIDRSKFADCTLEFVFDNELGNIEYFVLNSECGANIGGSGWEKVEVNDLVDNFVLVLFKKDYDTTHTVNINANFYVKIKQKDGSVFTENLWYNEQGEIVRLEEYGLSLNDTPSAGDEIAFQTREGSLIPFQNTLMPPRYRERQDVYYNAVNDTYELPDGSGKYKFAFPYSANDIREHKETFDFIKPSIEYVKYNYEGKELPVNMFVEFAYDTNDNDEVDEEKNEYIHPYFFGKLRPLGFNLFDSANEKGEMTISMTSGSCGACNFVIGVDENTKRNIVQVDDNGDLLREENGDVKFGLSQEKQNDTTNNYVWIALKKDTETYTNIRPNATYNSRPKACSAIDATDGDTFVILNITLPTKYILEAEKELEREIIAYLKENNDEKFSFSIKFSRIFLAENPSIAKALNENARIQVEYNNTTIPFYITSYTYKCVGNEALPEISVELSEELKFNESFLQRALSNVEKSVLSKVGDMDFAVQSMKYFLRKDVNDVANGLIKFQKGATFGANENAKLDEQGNADFVSQIIRQYISTPQFVDGFAGTGLKLWLDENGKSNLTVDNITAREAFRVFEMLVTKLRAVNGGLFVSAANGTIKEVVDSGEYYDIILENDNTFVAGDYMRCQVMSGLKIMDYWVEIYSTNGKTCRVLKSEFGDVMPLVGQDVVLDGSRNKNRQGAIYITANEDGLPRIEVLDNIGTKSHDGCLKTRLGSLNDIVDATFGQLSGYGLYSDNAYLKGEFIVKSTGESVDTMFAVQDGKIKSTVKQTQAEAIKGKTLLHNASFTDGLDGWITSNEADTLYDDGGLLFSHDSLLAQSVSIFSDPTFENVFFLNINRGWIKQHAYRFVDKPEFDNTKQYPLFFSCNVRCKYRGVLNVYMTGISSQYATTFKGVSQQSYEDSQWLLVEVSDKRTYALQVSEEGYIGAGDEIAVKICNDGEPLLYNLTRGYEYPLLDWRDEQMGTGEEHLTEAISIIHLGYLEPTSDFVSVNIDGNLWNGTGDFYLSFSGEADFYGITIYTEKSEVRHQTLFEQTDKLIRIAAENFDANGNIIATSSIVTTAKMNAAFSKKFNEDGSLINAAGLVTATELSGMDLINSDSLKQTLEHYVGVESFAGLFAEAVNKDEDIVKKAEISAFVTKTEAEQLVSNIKISADNISLEGLVTANGKVKINSDGTLTAEDGAFSGTITATKGKIGGFDIDNKNLVGVKEDSFGRDIKLTLTPSSIEFAYKEQLISIGSTSVQHPLYIANGYESISNNTGLCLDVYNSEMANHAIQIDRGCIAGFRMKTVRPMISAYEMDALDNVVFVSSRDVNQIKLPATPERGHIVYFRKTTQTDHAVTLKGNGKKIVVTMSTGDIVQVDDVNIYNPNTFQRLIYFSNMDGTGGVWYTDITGVG